MATRKKSPWERRELVLLVVYAIIFYIILIRRSLQLSRDHYQRLYGLRPGWLADWYNDLSDAQWRNFRGNLPLLTLAFGIFTMLAHTSRALFGLKARGTAIILLVLSLAYLSHLHGVCIIFVFSIASANFYIVKIFAKRKYFPLVLWSFNLSVLLCNRVYEGYPFSSFGQNMAYLDNFRGTFRWHICFNFVILRMISFGYDYHWAQQDSCFDQEKHIRRCQICKSGRICYRVLQDRGIKNELFSYSIYLSYLVYAPLYIAGPVLSFNAFAAQLDRPQNSCPKREVAWYGLRWVFNLFLMELMTHLFYYNAFAVSGTWKQVTPMEVFIIGYGVLNFMWLKFLLIWRYFRFWSLINGIEVPENMPKCINNCYNLESFWKNWHASFNKWLVRYLYIPLGGSHRKLLNIWVVFTFVAVWHDLEWKLLSWAWLTCFFFLPEMLVKSAANTFKVKSAIAQFIFRELSAFAGAITITCLMVANLVGYVIGPSGINWLLPQFVEREGLPVLGGMFVTFYAGTKLMFHLQDCEVNERKD